MKSLLTAIILLSQAAYSGSIQLPTGGGGSVEINPRSWDYLNKRVYRKETIPFDPVLTYLNGGFVHFDVELSYNFEYQHDHNRVDYQQKNEFWRNHNVSWRWFDSHQEKNARNFYFKDSEGIIQTIHRLPVEVQKKIQPLCLTISASLEASDLDEFNQDLSAKMHYRFPLLHSKEGKNLIISPDSIHEDQLFWEADYWNPEKLDFRLQAKNVVISDHMPDYHLANANIRFDHFEILDVQFDLVAAMEWYYKNAKRSKLPSRLISKIETLMSQFFTIKLGSRSETSSFISKLKKKIEGMSQAEEISFLHQRYGILISKIEGEIGKSGYDYLQTKNLKSLVKRSRAKAISSSEVQRELANLNRGEKEIANERAKVQKLKANNCGFKGRQDPNDLYATTITGRYSTRGRNDYMNITAYFEPELPKSIRTAKITNLSTGSERIITRTDSDIRYGRISYESYWEEDEDKDSEFQIEFDGLYQPARFKLKK